MNPKSNSFTHIFHVFFSSFLVKRLLHKEKIQVQQPLYG